jgi:hypothetical protein
LREELDRRAPGAETIASYAQAKAW